MEILSLKDPYGILKPGSINKQRGLWIMGRQWTGIIGVVGVLWGDGMPCFCCAQSIFAAGTAAAGQTGTEKADGEAGKPGRTGAGLKAGRYRWKPEGICTWKASRIGKLMTAGIQEGDFPSLSEEAMFPEVAAPRNRLCVPIMKA